MGTIYRTTCGCIASAPEPSSAEYDHPDEYQRAHDRWANAWATDIAEHHPYCCQARHRGDLVRCLEGLDDECPQVEDRRLALGELAEELRYLTR